MLHCCLLLSKGNFYWTRWRYVGSYVVCVHVTRLKVLFWPLTCSALWLVVHHVCVHISSLRPVAIGHVKQPTCGGMVYEYIMNIFLINSCLFVVYIMHDVYLYVFEKDCWFIPAVTQVAARPSWNYLTVKMRAILAPCQVIHHHYYHHANIFPH